MALIACLGCGEDEPQVISPPPPTRAVATLSATVASTPPAAFSPTVTARPEWKPFSAPGVEVRLPPTYAGGATTDPAFDAVVAEIRRAGRGDIAEIVQANRNAFILFASDSASAGTLFVTREPVPEQVTPEIYIDAGLQRFSRDLSIAERTSITIDGNPAIRITTLERGSGSMNYRFVTKSGDAIWSFVYTAPGFAFASQAATFQGSAETIRLR